MIEQIRKKKEQTAEIERQVQLIVFKIEQQEYALPIHEVKEVVITPTITPVPFTPDYVLGVANIRGNIFAIIDLAVSFYKKELDLTKYYEQKTYTLVLAHDEWQVGIIVNEVPNTLNVLESQIDLSPALVQDSQTKRNYIKGIVKLEDRIVLLLHNQAIINPKDFEIAQA
ncbi:MAG: chemotaxis protein CheW [Bacteroidia bacterium]|nr:chemotaxis protein CheW [Bacteroidia bacterium]MDW8300879.1 chemotaxis protein CheW [Bacteroidia bacterium]